MKEFGYIRIFNTKRIAFIPLKIIKYYVIKFKFKHFINFSKMILYIWHWGENNMPLYWGTEPAKFVSLGFELEFDTPFGKYANDIFEALKNEFGIKLKA